MPDTDDVEKFLADQKSFENRKQALIDDVLRQRADVIKAFDDKLAKLGYHPDGAAKGKRNHHKPDALKVKDKAKA